MEKIIRNIGNVELRSFDNPESRTVTGYAAVFESPSEDLGFIEVIKRGAITQELIDSCDVFAKFNHDDTKILARSNHGVGSLRLSVDDYGLRYEFEASHTDLGDTLLENIRRGEITQSSFAFAIDLDDHTAQRWEKHNGKLYRTVNKIAYLYDVSPVWQPAYTATTVDKRSKEEAENILSREKEYDDMLAELDKYTI
jgi:hypothetical protein